MIDEILQAARILIIDDENLHVALLTKILEDHGYRHFHSATDPCEALRLHSKFQPDLIILDWLMAGISGAQVLAQLRAVIPAESYLPILVVTAEQDIEVRRQALAGGASDFLTKPFDSSEIVLRVDNLVRTRLLHRGLEENQHRLKALFENVLDAIVVIDDDTRYIDANPAAHASVGLRNHRGQENDRHVAQGRVRFQLSRHVAAVLPRHVHIEQNQIGAILACRGERERGAVFDAHFEALRLFEEETDEAREIRFIVHDKDAGFVHRVPVIGNPCHSRASAPRWRKNPAFRGEGIP